MTRHVAFAALALAAAGCASVPPGPAEPAPGADSAKIAAAVAAGVTAGTKPGASTTAVVQAASAAAAAAAGPKPFAEVVRDAKEHKGLFALWQKDEKVWIEIAPEQFGREYLFTANLSRGVGEQRVYGGMMLRAQTQIVEFRRIGNVVQLIAVNHGFTGGDNAAMARGVREGFTDSLIGSTTVASQPHPERRSVLVDANALLLSDIPAGGRFTAGIQQRNYTFDARNSSFEMLHSSPDQVSFTVSAHYSNPKANLPPAPAAAPVPNPFPPFGNLPDARSLFLGYTYNIAALPEPMPARRADPRVGHFDTEVWDFSTDANFTAKTHFADRWRLEKKDPAAELSEPKEPIVFWIDRNVPERYRPAVRAGILEWNKAFERIGFRDAIVVKQQEPDAAFDTFDARHSTVRWYVATDATSAIGPSTVDPRTGEILGAQVAIPESWSRVHRTFITEEAPGAAAARAFGAALLDRDGYECSYASDALGELEFGLDVLEARGDIEPGSAAADAFVDDVMKAVVMHEVGHALGLRHNFRASTVYPLAQISDPAFSRTVGISGSVMDYNPLNIAVRGEPQGAYTEPTIGPYDYWAIEYAYRPLPKEAETEELARIAARGATDPLLAFSSDEEVIAGLDPAANQFDLGADPLLYLQKRYVISRELFARLENRKLKPGESYDVLRRNFDAGFRQVIRATAITTKYVGGVYYVRDYAGAGSLPLTPVAPDKQRAALKLVAGNVFSADSFRFRPEFMRSMGIDYLDVDFRAAGFNPDFSLRSRVLALQTATLNQLMGDVTMARLIDSETKVGQPAQALTLSELFATLRSSIWSELATDGSIPAARRDLQREHLRRMVNVLTHPAPATPADARALLREEARLLSAQIRVAAANGHRDRETRAHLSDAASTLDEALKAPMIRQGT